MKYLKLFFIILYTLKTVPTKMKLDILKKRLTQEKKDMIASKEAKNWAKNIIKISGGKIKVSGEENIPEGPCLFVGNHQGNFDIMLLLATIDKEVGFVAKKEMEKLPIISAWMKKVHCVFLDRENPREAIKTFNDAVENLKKGYSMVIFPEGTRSKSTEMGEFKKGSLKLATKVPEIPIIPVACEGTYKLFESSDSKNVEIKVSFCKPVYLNNLEKEDKINLSNYCREIIENELEKIR